MCKTYGVCKNFFICWSSGYPHIKNAKTSNEACGNLQKAFEDKWLIGTFNLSGILISLKLKQIKTMHIYVTNVVSVDRQMADINKSIEDEFFAVSMLHCSLSTYVWLHDYGVDKFRYKLYELISQGQIPPKRY